WLPTGKLFDSCTNKVESEPSHGSNIVISKIHECKQTLDLSAGTSINVPKEQNLNASADQNSSDPAPEYQTMASDQLNSDPASECQTMASDQNSSDPVPECQTTALNHDSLSLAIQRQGKVVSKSSAVSAADAPNQQTYAKNDQVADDEFINIFSTSVQDQGETSSRHVDSSNMHTFYQRYPSELRWTKDHPLEQVIRNPLQSVRTRRQLESDAEICMFAHIVSRTEPKNIKEAMADSAWIAV
nr:hypothetical protein [Tanacetum cinerariifolium]